MVAVSIRVFSTGVLLFTLNAGAIARAQTPTRVIATVLIDFVHTCRPDQRAALEALMADPATSTAERTVSAALLRVEHRPHPEDLPALVRVSKDASLPAGIRVLARVVHNLTHAPNKTQRTRLLQLLD